MSINHNEENHWQEKEGRCQFYTKEGSRREAVLSKIYEGNRKMSMSIFLIADKEKRIEYFLQRNRNKNIMIFSQ